jgi:hypothetical protein
MKLKRKRKRGNKMMKDNMSQEGMKTQDGFVDLKEDPKRLNSPESPSYPRLYLGKNRMKELFSGSKMGESYNAQIKCNLDGGDLEVTAIKIEGAKEEPVDEGKDETMMDEGK